MILLSYDVTEFMCFPNMTNRPLKGQGNTDFRTVPWLQPRHPQARLRVHAIREVDEGRQPYPDSAIITLSDTTLPCRTLFKADPTNPQHKARRLVLIANYSENTNFKKWFDSVEILFG
jgi:hypothetical protein